MSFQKFGTGKILPPDENPDPQGITKKAAAESGQWTPQDERELAQEGRPQPDED